ncbi:MAG: hypothetical protein L0241_25125 [Planctomycetia bacterium]|nr:hypothetical protein [Planctomycetia bacterium]
MRAVVFGLVAVCLVGLSSTTQAADDNKELIIGTWEITYSDTKDIPVGTKLEFTANGKVKLTITVEGKEITVDAGGYKIEKDIFTLTGKDGSKSDKGRICLLNKSSFVLNDEIEDMLLVLKRVKKK